MWIYLALASAVLLGLYDVAKKQSLKRNSVMWVLLAVSVLSSLLLAPFFRLGPAGHFALLVPKALLVSTSWISGLAAMKLLPLTTVSTIKASRPVFVVVLSMVIFGERLSLLQWTGVILALTALWLLSRSSRSEGIIFHKNKGIWWMGLSVVSGVASALYDKYIMKGLDPMFVLCWSNLYVAVVLAVVLGVKNIIVRHRLKGRQTVPVNSTADIMPGSGLLPAKAGSGVERFKWDWYLLLTAVLIVLADGCYFYSLSIEGAMLSIISLVRRFSVVVTFVLGALLFKEQNIRAKAIDLFILLSGIAILVFSS